MSAISRLKLWPAGRLALAGACGSFAGAGALGALAALIFGATGAAVGVAVMGVAPGVARSAGVAWMAAWCRTALGADATFPPELLHETNYAIEVLEKEFPKINRAKIAQAIGNARSNSAPTADRWQILQEARRLLSDR